MSVDIGAQVTAVWPTTEVSLTADSDVSYAANKVLAIARAKRQLYQSVTVPAEASIPEVAAYWVSDQAVVYLIPLAIDWYKNNARLSDAKEGATVTWYNRVEALENLRSQLEAELAQNLEAARLVISAQETTESVPSVSHKGMMVDPMDRAMKRGPW